MSQVSDKTKTAVVTFDDTKADVKTLIKATTEAGYPSFPYTEGMLWPARKNGPSDFRGTAG